MIRNSKPIVVAAKGNGPGGGYAIHGAPTAPVPPSVHRHEYESVEPMPVGPIEFERIQRRCPIVVGLPGSIM